MSLTERVWQTLQVLRFTPFDASTEEGRSKERYRLIALSTVSSFAAKVITSLLGLVTVPLTINYLGKEQFGLWMVVSSLVVWMQLADFGISNGLTNALAEAHGRDDRAAARAYFSTALVANVVISIACAVPLAALAYWLPWDAILNIQNQTLSRLASTCFLIAGLVFVFGMPVSVVNRVFVAFQHGYAANTTQIISSIWTMAGLLVAINFKLSLPWLVLLVSSGPVLGGWGAWIVLDKKLPWCKFDLKLVSKKALRRVAQSSVPMFVFQIGALLLNQLVNVILANLGSLNMVADYNILSRIYILVFTIGSTFSLSFYPAMREAYEKGESIWIYRSMRRLLFSRIGIYVLFSVILICFGDKVIYLWIKQPLTEGFGVYGWIMMCVLLIVSGLGSTFSEILLYLDYIKEQLPLVLINAFIFIASSFALIPEYGLKGFYLSSIFGVIVPTIYSLKLVRKVLIRICQ